MLATYQQRTKKLVFIYPIRPVKRPKKDKNIDTDSVDDSGSDVASLAISDEGNTSWKHKEKKKDGERKALLSLTQIQLFSQLAKHIYQQLLKKNT